MRKKYLAGFCIIGIAAIVALLWSKHDAIEQAKAYKFLIAGNADLSSISFKGQQRYFKTEDRFIVDDFEKAFENKKKSLNRSGITYTAIF
ncbi:MAG TPA: hypothetical protein VG347_04350 [Verrucomicrobiae bacterium]|nr:hypothetical protein [Verrucomicrobiae bacterium]